MKRWLIALALFGCSSDNGEEAAAITKSVEEIEAARAKSPNDKMLTKCMVNDVTFALKQLKTPDDAKPLLARYAAACPDDRL